MSLFFDGERKPKVTPVAMIPDWEAALEGVSHRYDAHVIAAHGHISVEQARNLTLTCRRVEPMLIAAIQAGTVTTQASAVDFIRANTEGFFPAAKFVARMKELVAKELTGSESPPATWPQVATAAQTEDVG